VEGRFKTSSFLVLCQLGCGGWSTNMLSIGLSMPAHDHAIFNASVNVLHLKVNVQNVEAVAPIGYF